MVEEPESWEELDAAEVGAAVAGAGAAGAGGGRAAVAGAGGGGAGGERGAAGGERESCVCAAMELIPHGRGLHSFTLELNLSKSRTPS